MILKDSLFGPLEFFFVLVPPSKMQNGGEIQGGRQSIK
jgi:hypothetical protein